MGMIKESYVMQYTIGIDPTVYYKAIIKEQGIISNDKHDIRLNGYSRTLYNGPKCNTYEQAEIDLNSAMINNLRRV